MMSYRGRKGGNQEFLRRLSRLSIRKLAMNEAGNRGQEFMNQRARYILLAIEAEALSDQAVSPYLREATHRLSQFWLTCAAAVRDDENVPEEFHAPTRNEKSSDGYNS